MIGLRSVRDALEFVRVNIEKKTAFGIHSLLSLYFLFPPDSTDKVAMALVAILNNEAILGEKASAKYDGL